MSRREQSFVEYIIEEVTKTVNSLITGSRDRENDGGINRKNANSIK